MILIFPLNLCNVKKIENLSMESPNFILYKNKKIETIFIM